MTHPALSKDQIKAEARVVLQTKGALEAAKFLARTLFDGRMDRAGTPYFGHLERVANGIPSDHKTLQDALRTIAYLHDLIEDIVDDPAKGIIGWTFQDLADIGFDDFTIAGVRALTKEDELYFDEMVRLGQTPQAIPVKKSDHRDNTNILRAPHLPTAEDIQRLRKYYLSYRYLCDVESGQTAPGTPFSTWMKSQPRDRQDWDLLKKYSRHPDVVAMGHITGLFPGRASPAP